MSQEQEPIINGYLRQMLSMGGSDLHLSINFPAKARIHGNIQCLDDNVITPEFMEELMHEICLPAWRWDEFMRRRDLDFAHEIPGLARFRCNFFYNYHGMFCDIQDTIRNKNTTGNVLITIAKPLFCTPFQNRTREPFR